VKHFIPFYWLKVHIVQCPLVQPDTPRLGFLSFCEVGGCSFFV
jgi:hypothetical protein